MASKAATAAAIKKAEEEKKLNEWLPITSYRDAKWWYSAFHNVTAMVGAGILGLPFAMSELGCYSAMAWTTSLQRGVQPDVRYTSRESTTAGKTFAFLSALGDVAIAFAGHNVVLEIQATINSTPETPSKNPCGKGVFPRTMWLLCVIFLWQ